MERILSSSATAATAGIHSSARAAYLELLEWQRETGRRRASDTEIYRLSTRDESFDFTGQKHKGSPRQRVLQPDRLRSRNQCYEGAILRDGNAEDGNAEDADATQRPR